MVLINSIIYSVTVIIPPPIIVCMKNCIFFVLLCSAFLVMLSSCEEEVETVIDDTTTHETMVLREQYSDKITGGWISVIETESSYLEQHYSFGADGKMTGKVFFKSRKNMVNGESVFTDWEILADEDVAGTWDLRYVSSLQKNVLYMNVDSEYAFNNPIEFVSVDNSVLEITSPFFLNEIIKMQRVAD